MKTKLSYKKKKTWMHQRLKKKKDNKHRPSLSTVLSMVDVVFFLS